MTLCYRPISLMNNCGELLLKSILLGIISNQQQKWSLAEFLVSQGMCQIGKL